MEKAKKEQNMNGKKRKLISTYNDMSVVAKATIWFMVCSVIQKGLSFITTPIFTRLMTQEQFGVYSVYVSWTQILTIFASFRLDYSVFNKGMSKYPEDRDGYASSMLGLTSLITGGMCVLYLVFQKQVNSFTELIFFKSLILFPFSYTTGASIS